jgi:murein L,D-transpeptidase YafK
MSSLPFKTAALLVSAFFLMLALWPAGSQAASSRTAYYGSNINAKADYILIEKRRRKMTLYRNGRQLRSYRISLGKGGVAPKEREGDMRTPEGVYYIDGRNPESMYHLSLKISYPNASDRRRAAARGVSPGGNIMIHGVGDDQKLLQTVSYRQLDWTAGCVAVTNSLIEEIWRMVPDGTPVEIRR